MRVPVLLVTALLLLVPAAGFAEPSAPATDRVQILRIEMRRGPARLLRPFLAKDADATSRALAIRALGRIGDRGEAPELLADLLKQGTDLLDTLWAAGIAQTDKLYEPIQAHLKSKQPEVVAAAAEALGWTKKADAINDLTPLLGNPDARIRRGALRGLARLRPEGVLERVLPLLRDPDASVRRAAGFSGWMLAGARRRGAKAQDEAWGGDFALAKQVLPLLSEPSADRRMDGLRILGSLLGKADLTAGPMPTLLQALVADADPRVVADVATRLLAPRKTDVSDRLLVGLLDHLDPKVRERAVEALGEHGSEAAAAALAAGMAKEADARVREAYLVERARLGDEAPWQAARKDPRRSEQVERALRQLTDVRVRLLSKRPEALDELFQSTRPDATGRGLHAAALLELFSGLDGREDTRIEPWLARWLPGGGPFDVDDPYVAAAAIGLVGKNHDWKRLADLRAGCALDNRDMLHDEVRLALAGAFGDLATDAACPPADRTWMTEWLRWAMYGDRSAWVRAKAKASLEQIGEPDLPAEDPLPPTDWRGLPRPSGAVLGIDLSAGAEAWLDEAEILTLADAIRARAPRIRFETSAGSFDVELFPDEAPVHCVSLVLAVEAGLYTGTRWHRVVPNFVIQGGDPHGHGGGNGGWFVPDEITRRSYVRGALGMPKSRKDDGGCQLFFMHTRYLPLDERYTNYGQITSGMDVVDRIRVGDTIRGASLVLSGD